MCGRRLNAADQKYEKAVTLSGGTFSNTPRGGRAF
jgi:hypothetical protein